MVDIKSIKSFCILIVSLFLIACGETHNPSPLVPISLSKVDSYRLVWQDEFSGDEVDRSKWNYDLGAPLIGGSVWGNDEKQYYTNSTKNVSINAGKLIIQAVHETPSISSSYQIATSGRIKSDSTNFYSAIGNYPYGFYEIRAKISCTAGSWPAIWSLGKNGDWPDRGEIDILEWFGRYYSATPNQVYSAVHTRANHGGNDLGKNQFYDGLCGNFHNYQLHWTVDYLAMGVNDSLTFSYRKPTNASNNTWPFEQPAFLIMNVAVGGNLGGEVNSNDIPSMRMEVDYVRVWKNQNYN